MARSQHSIDKYLKLNKYNLPGYTLKDIKSLFLTAAVFEKIPSSRHEINAMFKLSFKIKNINNVYYVYYSEICN